MEGPGADSEEKHEPASDIDTAWMDSLKVLDPEGPIREEKRTWLDTVGLLKCANRGQKRTNEQPGPRRLPCANARLAV